MGLPSIPCLHWRLGCEWQDLRTACETTRRASLRRKRPPGAYGEAAYLALLVAPHRVPIRFAYEAWLENHQEKSAHPECGTRVWEGNADRSIRPKAASSFRRC